MSRKLYVSSRAEADIAATYAWYQMRGVDLGVDFVRCVEATFERVRLTPQIFRQRHGLIRLAMTPRFPYAVYFIWDETDDFISIRRVLHLAQNAPARLDK
jgi:plasmid stabilization system protein ParE